MKVIRLRAENFKRIEAVDITPADNTIVISGKNGAGKSSVLDAIESAICGKRVCPDKPIRTGQDRAEIEVELDDFTVRRIFTQDGSRLEIVSKDGVKAKSPQAFLDTLVGKISFDPLDFRNKPAAQQRQILLDMAGLNPEQYAARLKELRSRLDSERRMLQATENEAIQLEKTIPAGTPDEQINIGDVYKQIKAATDANIFRSRIGSEYLQRQQQSKILAEEIAELEEKLSYKKEQKAEIDELVIELHGKYSSMVEVDTTVLQREIDDAEKINREVAKRQRVNEIKEMALAYVRSIEITNSEIKAVEADRDMELAMADLPVPGLSITDDGVVYEGIPLSQVNTAKALEISVAVSMALNPTLKVLRMSGNDLDSESLDIIRKLVKDNDYQAWIEKVDETGNIGIVIEDGKVAKVQRTKANSIKYNCDIDDPNNDSIAESQAGKLY